VIRFSTSFSEEEIDAMYQFFSKTMKGEDVKYVTKNKSFSSVIKKIIAMKNKKDGNLTVK